MIKNNVKEYIVCAAMYYDDGEDYPHQPKNIDLGYVVCGLRHCNCIQIGWMLDEEKVKLLKKAGKIKAGFLTSTNKFVDRIEARKIALKAGQIKEESFHDTELFSEDIY